MKAMNQLLYRTLSARTSRLSTALRTPPDPIRLLLLFGLCGTAVGGLLCTRLPQLAGFPLLTQGLAVSDAVRTLWAVFLWALLPMLVLLGGVLLSAGAVFGQPLLLAMLFARGLGAGIAMTDCFVRYPFQQAFFASAVLIFPFAYFSLLILVHAVREAFPLSYKAAQYLLRGQADDTAAALHRRFLLRMLLRMLGCIPAAGLHTLLLWGMNDRLLNT